MIKNLFDKIVLEQNEGYKFFKIEGLQQGEYELQIKNPNYEKKFKHPFPINSQKYNITVHKGTYWGGNSFILENSCFIEKPITR